MKKVVWTALAVFALAIPAAHAQTFTSGPTSGQTVLKPEQDYATVAWQDAWDMDKRTDIGWMTWGADAAANFGSRAMVGCTSGTTGCSAFEFTASGPSPLVFLLDTWQPGSSAIGKVGHVKPIDTTKYKYLLLKMKVQTGIAASEYGAPASLGVPQIQVSWSRDTIYYDATLRPTAGQLVSLTDPNSTGTFGNPGMVLDSDGIESNQYKIYALRLDQQHWWNVSANPVTEANPVPTDSGPLWGTSTGDSLFLTFVPNNALQAARFGAIDLAWARLTTTAQSNQTIAWTGGASYDIVVSPNSDCSGYTVLDESRTSPYTFDFGALAPGTYYVGLRPSRADDGPGVAQSDPTRCSGGSYVVPDFATLNFSSPTDQGSSDDFATSFLGGTWDFDALADADRINDMSAAAGQPAIDAAFPAERPSGTSLGNIRVMKGTSPTSGDPYAYMLWFNGRGLSSRIDPDRYRIFTMDMGLDASRSVGGGSIARIIWHVAGDYGTLDGAPRALENVSEDLVIRHLKFGTETSKYILDRVQVDMKDRGVFPVDTTADPPSPNESSPSRSGWTSLCVSPYCTSTPANPGVDAFRIDFHEFTPPTMSYIQQAKLAALEQTGSSYTISWSANVPTGYTGTVVKLYASKQTVTTQPSFPSYLPYQPTNGVILTPTSTCSSSDGTLVALTTTTVAAGTASGSYAWTPSTTALDIADGSEVYICGIVQGTISGTTYDLASTMTKFPVKVNVSYVQKPRLFWNRSTLRFGAVHGAGGTLLSKTPDQIVDITQVGSGTANWQVASIMDVNGAVVDYITVTPMSGTGTGTMTVSLSGAGIGSLPACSAQDGLGVVIKLTTGGTTDNEPQYIRTYVTIRPQTATAGCIAPSGVPTGSFDTPTDGATGVVGAIPVTGWALDDVGVSRVMLWRNCVEAIDRALGACTSAYTGSGPNFVYIGDGAFLPGARPDVEALVPLDPMAYRAGWGYLMLTTALPHIPNGTAQGGQGQFTLYAVAIDEEGNYNLLGSKTIALDNDHATVPFGAIDTPNQGGTVTSSLYNNFGWAMTQSGKCITTSDVRSYRVYIDGVSRTLTPGTNWTPGLTRPDIAGAYPGLCNTNDALAAYTIDTATLGLANGLHTIGWDIYDDNGTGGGVEGSSTFANVAGIGSRFFNLLVATSTNQHASLRSPAGRQLGYPAWMLDGDRLAGGAVIATRQQRGDAPIETLATEAGGATLVADEIERLQLELPQADGASAWDGYAVVNGSLDLLPLGSTLDAKSGTFYWQPVAGYVGNYDFMFVRRGSDGQQEKLPVRVTYRPRFGSPTFRLAN